MISDPWLEQMPEEGMSKSFRATLKMWFASFPEEERFAFELWALERNVATAWPAMIAFREGKTLMEFLHSFQRVEH